MGCRTFKIANLSVKALKSHSVQKGELACAPLALLIADRLHGALLFCLLLNLCELFTLPVVIAISIIDLFLLGYGLRRDDLGKSL